jgi:acetyl esterase/lipase
MRDVHSYGAPRRALRIAHRAWFPGSLFARTLFAAASVLLAALPCAPRAQALPAPASAELVLWPGVAPGSAGVKLQETLTERSKDPAVRDRFVSGVLQPSLSPFKPAKPNGAAVIIAPGGGYVREVLDKESFEIASWLSARGVSAFVLKYRLPGEGHADRAEVPLRDAQRAVRLLRARAAEFRLDPGRIGFLGFSAGGHLAATLSTRFADRVYEPVDAVDQTSARPDFTLLLYPVISMDEKISHSGSRQALLGETPSAEQSARYSADLHVTKATPPALLILADDDPFVPSEHALRYYRALHQAGVGAELHIYAKGGHGFGMRGTKGLPLAAWPEVALAWLTASGFVPAAATPR